MEPFRPENRRAIEAAFLHEMQASPLSLSAYGGGHTTAGESLQRQAFELAPLALRGLHLGTVLEGESERSVDDFRYVDRRGVRHLVDVKARDLDGDQYMPNLISAGRLSRLYGAVGADAVCLDLLHLHYRRRDSDLVVESVHYHPLEWLAPACWTIQNQGTGVLQLVQGVALTLDETQTRAAFMVAFCEKEAAFLASLRRKVDRRAAETRVRRERWAARSARAGTGIEPGDLHTPTDQPTFL